MTLRPLLALVLPLALAACATAVPKVIPEDYDGPTAKVLDWGDDIGPSKAALYVLEAIDGQRIDTTVDATRRRSAGAGFTLTVDPVERDIPARPMQATLRATHVTAAPVLELASRAAGTFHAVSGVVAFDPKPGRTYVVMGTLGPQGSQVWIEEEGTKRRVTEVVRGP